MSINGRMEEQECVNGGAANGENENVGTLMKIIFLHQARNAFLKSAGVVYICMFQCPHASNYNSVYYRKFSGR